MRKGLLKVTWTLLDSIDKSRLKSLDLNLIMNKKQLCDLSSNSRNLLQSGDSNTVDHFPMIL